MRTGRDPVIAVRRRHVRRGVTLILAMACLVVVAMVGMSLLGGALRQHRQTRQQYFRLQALWLAESGVLRATEQLGRRPDYSGEVWNIPAEELGGAFSGTVTIREVRARMPADRQPSGPPSDAGPAEPRREFLIEAKYPADSLHGVLQRRRLLVSPTSSGGSS